MVKDAIVAGTCFLLALFLAGVGGCIQHEVTAPQLDPIVTAAKVITSRQPQPGLNLKPLPKRVTVTIDGDSVEVDDGGLQLLRGYADCRAAYQAALTNRPGPANAK